MGALQPGQMLAESYRVLREIGAGGMGVVYEIEHVRLKKRYVAKVIHDEYSREEGAAKRMEREAQVLAAINHRSVVQVHDVGTTREGLSYFVMEKLEGVDLRSLLRREVVPRVRALDIMIDVLDALEYVHRRGIVHRDIKPENIFLAEDTHGTATKVLDFGIVHIFDGDGRISQGRITKTGGFVGTLHYAAPEQMQGNAASPPNDVYASALVLFELIAGRGPFDDDPGVGLSRCFKPAPRLGEFVPRPPRGLTELLAKALEREPSQRPTAGAFAAELRTLRADEAAAANDPLRNEIEDLLRGIPRLAEPAASSGDKRASTAPPILVGSPSDHTSGEAVAFDATLASPTGDPPAPRQPSRTGPPSAPTHAPHTLPLPGRFDSGKRLESSPGVYATVNGPQPLAPATSQARWWRVVGLSVALLLGSLVAALAIVNSGGSPTNSVPMSSGVSSITALEAPSATPLPPPSASASATPPKR